MTMEPAVAVVARKQVSRRKLLDAARSLFIERGYHDTRPQDIARAAGVGHGTFYLHFADKRECFLAFVDEAATELHDCVVQHTKDASDIEGYVRGVFEGCHAYNLAQPNVLAAALVDATVIGGGESATPLIDRWAHEWTERLEEMAEKGLISLEVDPRIVGHAIVGACHQAFVGGARDGLRFNELRDGLIAFMVNALDPERTN